MGRRKTQTLISQGTHGHLLPPSLPSQKSSRAGYYEESYAQQTMMTIFPNRSTRALIAGKTFLYNLHDRTKEWQKSETCADTSHPARDIPFFLDPRLKTLETSGGRLRRTRDPSHTANQPKWI